MKKSVYLFLVICLMLALLTSCGKPICHTAYDGHLPQLPFLEDDTSDGGSLGLYDGSAFGIVESTCKHGITIKMQDKSFFFAWTDLAKKAYATFGIKVGDEIAIPVDADENTYIARNIEKVM